MWHPLSPKSFRFLLRPFYCEQNATTIIPALVFSSKCNTKLDRGSCPWQLSLTYSRLTHLSKLGSVQPPSNFTLRTYLLILRSTVAAVARDHALSQSFVYEPRLVRTSFLPPLPLTSFAAFSTDNSSSFLLSVRSHANFDRDIIQPFTFNQPTLNIGPPFLHSE